MSLGDVVAAAQAFRDESLCPEGCQFEPLGQREHLWGELMSNILSTTVKRNAFKQGI